MTPNQTIIIHHANCIDGFTAAYVAWLKYGDTADYIPANYGDEPPDVRGKDVLILDFSYPRAVLERMHADAKSLRVLDHHKTAQADLAWLPYATFDMDRSGAGLAWDELHGGERPPLVNYVEDRDLWRWALPDSKAINAYIGSVTREFSWWQYLAEVIDCYVDDAILCGRAILQAQNIYVVRMREESRILVVGDNVVPVVNTTHATSELVGDLADGKLFAVGWYQAGDGSYRYSLRSRGDFDVSEIAKRYGGGGHTNAAGFEAAQGPDELFGRP